MASQPVAYAMQQAPPAGWAVGAARNEHIVPGKKVFRVPMTVITDEQWYIG